MSKASVLIVGGGIAGLTVAYKLTHSGYKVKLIEKSDTLGGLASCNLFSKDGIHFYYEKLYHHFFVNDKYLMGLLNELGLSKNIDAKKVKNLYPHYITNIVDLLLYLVLMFHNHRAFLHISFKSFYNKFGDYGRRLLFEYSGFRANMLDKFGVNWVNLPLSWLWARIHSRFNISDFIIGERLLVIKPSLQALIDALRDEIIRYHGLIEYNYEVIDLPDLLSKYETDYLVFTMDLPKIFEILRNDKIRLNIRLDEYKLPEYRDAINIILFFKKGHGVRYPQGVYWYSLVAKQYQPFIVRVHQNILNDSWPVDVIYLGGYVDSLFIKTNNHLFKEKAILLNYLKDKFEDMFFWDNLLDVKVTWAAYAQPIITTDIVDRLIPNSFTLYFNHRRYDAYIANFGNLIPWDRGVNFAIKQGLDVVKSIKNKHG